MSLAWFPILVLGVWRVTHLLAAEDGPGDVVAKLRGAAGSGFWGRLLDCFYCLSLWVAVPFAFALGTAWPEWIFLWLALSGAAILLERITERPAANAAFFESAHVEEHADGMLRK